MTHSVSTFFTGYSALLDEKRVEAVAVVISDEGGAEPVLRMVIVDEAGAASLVRADRLDMYGAYEKDDDATPTTS
ncbi:MAG TPA: hypothetical protein VFJ71_07695 [Candidatus Limnocylindrales bacterium]|nr:hypothetical protein [Candidatus Limnocylindrales bacterium]